MTRPDDEWATAFAERLRTASHVIFTSGGHCSATKLSVRKRELLADLIIAGLDSLPPEACPAQQASTTEN